MEVAVMGPDRVLLPQCPPKTRPLRRRVAEGAPTPRTPTYPFMVLQLPQGRTRLGLLLNTQKSRLKCRREPQGLRHRPPAPGTRGLTEPRCTQRTHSPDGHQRPGRRDSASPGTHPAMWKTSDTRMFGQHYFFAKLMK